MKLLIINAHPDDAEFTCASTCLQAVQLGWKVDEILMTSDQYGTPRDEFKGRRISRIRMQEMRDAATEYGTDDDGNPLINLIWFGEIDGYLPFNAKVLRELERLIENLDPDVIIAPDSFFSLDLHPDHLHTGWLAYIAVKRIDPAKRPELFLYHSYNANFFIPIKEIGIQVRAWSRHRSQTSPVKNKILLPLRKLFYFIRRRKTGPVIAEGFRRVDFTPGENNLVRPIHRMLYHFFARSFAGNSREYYTPTPEELGIR